MGGLCFVNLLKSYRQLIEIEVDLNNGIAYTYECSLRFVENMRVFLNIILLLIWLILLLYFLIGEEQP